MDTAGRREHTGWLKGAVRFAALLAGLLALLSVLNWIPGAVDKSGMRKYAGIEQLRHEPGFERVMVPSFFPEGIMWPPALVLGQKKPFMASVMEFDGKGARRALIISQSASAGFEPGPGARFSELRQSINMDLNGREALIETGLCADGTACSRLSWQQDGRLYVKLFMRAPSVTLISIAQSMF